MRVDSRCSVDIASFSENECSAAHPTNITIPGPSDPSDNTAIVAGLVIVVVVLIVAATVLLGIVAVVRLRGHHGSISLKAPEE